VGGGGQDDVLNVRKAVRFASKGKGGVAMARGSDAKRGRSKGGKGKR
jgi:regulator of ribosome biosynthesis